METLGYEPIRHSVFGVFGEIWVCCHLVKPLRWAAKYLVNFLLLPQNLTLYTPTEKFNVLSRACRMVYAMGYEGKEENGRRGVERFVLRSGLSHP